MRRELGRSVVLALAGRSLTALAGVTVTLLLPRYFSLADVGAVYLVITQATLFSLFARFGLDYSVNAALLAAATPRAAAQVKVAHALAILGFAALSAGLALVLAPPLAALAGIAAPPRHIGLVAAWGTAYAFSFYLFQLYKLEGHVLRATLSRGALPSIALAGTVGAWLLADIELSLDAALEGMLLVLAVAVALNGLVYFRRDLRREALEGGALRLAARGAPRFFSYSLLAYFISDLDYWFIAQLAGADDLAVYATMKRLALIAAILVDVANLAFPRFFREGLRDPARMPAVAQLARRAALLGAVAALAAVAVLVVAGRPLIAFFLGERFLAGHGVLVVLMLSFVFVLAAGFAEVFLVLKGDREVLLRSMGLTCLAVLVLNAVLVPRFGTMGAALSFLLCSFLMRISLSWAVWKRYDIRLFAGW